MAKMGNASEADMEALQVELDRVKNVAKAREQAVEKLTSELEATKEQVISFLAKNKEKDKQIKGLKQRFDEAEKEHTRRMENMAAQMRKDERDERIKSLEAQSTPRQRLTKPRFAPDALAVPDRRIPSIMSCMPALYARRVEASELTRPSRVPPRRRHSPRVREGVSGPAHGSERPGRPQEARGGRARRRGESAR